MKVLLVNGSPHKEGCTYTALKEVEKELKKATGDLKTQLNIQLRQLEPSREELTLNFRTEPKRVEIK